MPERSPALVGSALIVLALALIGACWFDARATLPLVWLAQIPAALGIALLRRTRTHKELGKDAGRLALLWGGGFLLTGALLAWPLLQLHASPSLVATLTLSGLAGVTLVLLWIGWPRWLALEQRGGNAAARHRQQQAQRRDAWSGLLQVAVPAFLLLVGGLLLAWPELLTGATRAGGSAFYAALAPLLHFALQSAPAVRLPEPLPVESKPVALPVVELATPKIDGAAAQVEAAPMPATAAEVATLGEQGVCELYVAARRGRVELALELLEAGADPNAAPEAEARDRRSLAVLAAVLPDLRLLRALISHGVDVNALEGGLNPLLAATRDSWHGRPEAVMTLLANGADVHIADVEGNTPLHHAARSSDPGVAALLRDAGADLNALNGDGS